MMDTQRAFQSLSLRGRDCPLVRHRWDDSEMKKRHSGHLNRKVRPVDGFILQSLSREAFD